MQPEISHRCASCGASVRERSMFCPECGKPLTRPGPGNDASRDAVQQAATKGSVPVDASWTGPELSAKREVSPPPPVDPAYARERIEADPLKTESRPNQASERESRARERTRDKISGAARGALGENVKRVGKIHHVSSAMLEEAAYDPSLRFVLVAVGLFVVFVILLVLSKVMG